LVVLAAAAVVVAVVGDALPTRREAQGRAVPPADVRAATLPSTTTATSVAPSPVPPTPPTTVGGDIQVLGEQVTRTPDTAPPPTAPAPVPASPSPPPPSDPPPCTSRGGADFVDALVNDHRSIRCEQGLGDVALDATMSEHAQYHAERLMQAGACASLFHSGELPQWYSTTYWGENAACVAWSRGCWSDAEYIMNGWMNSDEHRPNILDPRFRRIGVGVACDGSHTYVVVQFQS